MAIPKGRGGVMAIPIDWTIPQSYLDQSKELAALRARVAELEGVLQEIIDYADEGEIQDGVKAARAALAKEGE